MYSSRFFIGLISLCFMSFSAILWGSKWDSQKEVPQCKHDLIAVRIFFFGQLSQGTSDFFWTCFLLMPSAISLMVLFMLKSCFESNAFPHNGHIGHGLRSLWLLMQTMQKLWPQEVVTGSEYTSRHMEHVRLSLDTLLEEAMTLQLKS